MDLSPSKFEETVSFFSQLNKLDFHGCFEDEIAEVVEEVMWLFEQNRGILKYESA